MAGRYRLSATFVKNAPPGKHCDGGGLWFHKRVDGGAQWFLRITVHGRRREMGLGGFQNVSLHDARKLSEHWRALVAAGKDPIKERDRAFREKARADNTLQKVAEETYEAKKAELKGDGKAGRWFSPLELHVLPKLGKVPIEEIDQRDIREVLAPLWHTKAETARKALNRIGLVIKHGAALGLDVDLLAAEKAKALLGKTRHQPQHVPALPWADVPLFYSTLMEPSVSNLALRLLILTGVRSKPLRYIHSTQIAGDVWTIPAEAMKGLKGKTKDFRVPLSAEAARVIELAQPFEREGFIFPSQRRGVISDGTMSSLMARRGMTEKPHGFRSSLRTWIAETTDTPREVAEEVLAHVVGSSVERAYRRTDFLDQRRIIMDRWASHVIGS